MKSNLSVVRHREAVTHEGAPVHMDTNPLSQLRRSVLACLLWEESFYESGVSIADRIRTLVHTNQAQDVFDLAVEARAVHGLRHVPLLLVREMARGSVDHRALVEAALQQVIRRPDELTEFLAVYWNSNDGKKTLSAPIKRGLGAAFQKFDEYALAKYDHQGRTVKLRDVMFLAHARPKDVKVRYTRSDRKQKIEHKLNEHEALYKRLVEGELVTPDTWEVRLSAGENKLAAFESLIAEKKLGGLAFIRNLRNMRDAGVPKDRLLGYAVEYLIPEGKLWGILPWQFLTAARMCPDVEPMLDTMLLASMKDIKPEDGMTVVLVDVSGSMAVPLTGRGEATRIDAAAGVAILARAMYSDCHVFTFSNHTVEVPARQGMALRDAIENSQVHSGTYLAKAILDINKLAYKRLIVITDEQSGDGGAEPRLGAHGYIINVATYQNGVAYGPWMRIDGWAPAVLKYISEIERMMQK